MKKIVDGKLYDTSKSTVIYEDKVKNRIWYVTAKGAYFMVYVSTGELVPKTEDEAKEFLGENDTDKYVELFGEVEEA